MNRAARLKGVVWDVAASQVKENPQLGELLRENRDVFVKSASIGTFREVLGRVRQATEDNSSDSEKLSEIREFLQSKAKEVETKGWQGLQVWAKSVPGGEEVRLVCDIYDKHQVCSPYHTRDASTGTEGRDKRRFPGVHGPPTRWAETGSETTEGGDVPRRDEGPTREVS